MSLAPKSMASRQRRALQARSRYFQQKRDAAYSIQQQIAIKSERKISEGPFEGKGRWRHGKNKPIVAV